jgi:diguanylate cyclase (GGDEF)-like protein
MIAAGDRSSRLASDDIRSNVDKETAHVDRRFRQLFVFGALALVAINATVGLIILHQQNEMREVALSMYNHAFVSASYVNRAAIEFQRFADERRSVSGVSEIASVNQLLDPVIGALDAAAERADDPASRQERLDVRSGVLAFEALFFDTGPKIWSRLRATQEQLAQIAKHALQQGLTARDRIERSAANCQILLFASVGVGVLFGLVTLLVLRRSIALSTISRISRMANYDSVTGLPNRNLLHTRLTNRLDSARRKDASFAVLTIDLDRFKNVNDALGHQVGDLLLMEVAQRIRKVARVQDTAARFGGDEFVLLLDDMRDPAEAGRVAERLVAAIAAPYEFDGHRVLIGASIGIALAPQHGHQADDLLRNSDLALYLAKTEGKGQYRFFRTELNAGIQARRLMEIDLRETVENDRLEVFFQPVIDVGTREIIACEALARWKRDGHGYVPPVEFIPLAEETGLIVALGGCVLRKACEEAARWPRKIGVAVNLSARQFQSGDLVALVEDTLRSSGLEAQRLELEITESVFVEDKDRVLVTLQALRQLGVRIALDDFGTGYSSLSYLSSFPFDRIKIDRSFVTNVDTRPDAAAIVRAVTSLAGTLGMSTTAEGVESVADLAWLQSHGCGHAQGYLISRPVPPEELRPLLDPVESAVTQCDQTGVPV